MSSRQAGPPLHPPSSGPPGSLPPGTLVQVGPYTVSVKRYLSQGGFATVYLVNSDRPLPIPTLHGTSRNETLHVLKRIVVPDKEALADVRREVDVHKLLRSDAAVVHFLEASALCLPPPQTGYDVYILMEYCSGGGLLDLLNTRLRNRLSENEVLHIFLDVCKGLAAMHHLDPPVAHRDLKIENILIVAPTTPGGKPTYKLCDFGSAKPILSRRAPRSIEELKRLEADLNKSTTLPYRPPEMVDVYQRRVIDEKADIWAMGVLLYKLCYYTTPFEENGGGPLAILNVKYRFPSNPPYSDRIKGLIASLLVDPAARRPSIDQLIIKVHALLGTKPPASAMHYAQQAAKGQQVQPLPTQTAAPSSARALDDEVLVKIASSRRAETAPFGSSESSNRSRPASMAVRSSTRQRPDLISFEAPKSNATSKADETERLMKLEGIERMRRGRPGQDNKAKPTPTPAPVPSSPLAKLQAPPQPRSGTTSPQPPSAFPSPPPPSSSTTQQQGQAPGSGSRFGFGDSFSPPPAPPASSSPPSEADQAAVAAASGNMSPPPASATRQGPVAVPHPKTGTLVAVGAVESEPPVEKADTSAEGRYPSLEELDRRFPEKKDVMAAKESSASESRPSSSSAAIGGPTGVVASMASRYCGGPSSTSSGPTSTSKENGPLSPSTSSSSRPTPTLPPRKPAGWVSINSTASSRASTIDSGGREDAATAPRAGPGAAQRFGSIKSKPVPSPPSAQRKPSLPAPGAAAGMGNGSAARAGGGAESGKNAGGMNGQDEGEQEDEEEEDEGPEDAVASGSVRRRWAEYSRGDGDEMGRRGGAAKPSEPGSSSSATTKPAASQEGKIGKIVAPSWLEESRPPHARAETANSAATPLDDANKADVPTKPLIDFSSSSQPASSSSPDAPAPAPAQESASSISTSAAQRAPAWAWDGEDEDEVRDFKLAVPLGSPSKEAVGGRESGARSPMAVLSPRVTAEGGRGNGEEGQEKPVGQTETASLPKLEPIARLSPSPGPALGATPQSLSPGPAPSPANLLPSRAQPLRDYREAGTSPLPPMSDESVPTMPTPRVASPSTDANADAHLTAALEENANANTHLVGGHPAYAKGTASNMASRWERMGGAIQHQQSQPKAQRSGTALRNGYGSAGTGGQTGARSGTGTGLQAPIALPGLAKGNKPAWGARDGTDDNDGEKLEPALSASPAQALPPAPLKPWEREALEREAALARFVSAGRSDSPSPPPLQPSVASPPSRLRHADDVIKSVSSSSSPTPTPTPGGGAGAEQSPEQTAAARYRSVASLIDRWQANAGGADGEQKTQHHQRGREKGWGEIGSRAAGTAAAAAGGAAAQRLPGRDV